MRRFVSVLAIGSFIGMAGCASMMPKLAPAEMRQKEYVETTTVKKGEAYDRANEYFAKSFGDANSAIRLRDKENARIVAKGNVMCDALNLGNGFGKNQRAEFTLTFEAKDNKVRLTFEDLVATSSGSWDSGGRPVNQTEADKLVIECIAPVRAAIVQSLSTERKAASDW